MKTYKYIALAALALGFTACSQDDDFAPQQEDIVKIASANIATEVQTRVNTLDDGTAWESGDQILLVNNSRDDKNSGTYTYNGSAWSLTEDIVLYASGTDATNSFTAYYPASVDFTLPTDQSTEAGIKSADRMVATTSDDIAKGAAVSLNFKRQNAKVTIKPTITDEYGSSATISELTIAGVTPYHPAGATDYTAIIAPTQGFEVKVKVGDSEQTLTAPCLFEIEAGKHYTFALKVGKDVVNVNSVSVESWTDNALTDGNAEEVKVTVATNGTTATITIPELATDAMLQKAMQEFDAEGITTVVVNSPLTETQQGIIAIALANETISLYLPQMETSELIDDLVSTEDNISVYCGYYVDNGTYIVYNEEGLKAWRSYASSNLSTNLTLAADITLTASDVWSPIGANSSSPYTGAIEGNGHTIYNMTINPGYNNLAGMMGYMKGGSIKNLYLANVNVTSNNAHCGSFAGNIAGTLIENSGVKSGTIRQTSTSFQSFAGGIVGQSVGGTIVACYNAASIVNRYTSGGIVGYHDSSELNIIGCYNIGSVQVTGESWAYTAGGILGNFNSTYHNIKGCYNTGSVTSAQYDGQIPGAIGGRYSSSYTQSAYNYYSSDHSYGFGQTNGSTSNAGCTQISNTASEWEAAATEMNKALESYGYRYVANADESTQSTQPLVIEKI